MFYWYVFSVYFKTNVSIVIQCYAEICCSGCCLLNNLQLLTLSKKALKFIKMLSWNKKNNTITLLSAIFFGLRPPSMKKKFFLDCLYSWAFRKGLGQSFFATHKLYIMSLELSSISKPVHTLRDLWKHWWKGIHFVEIGQFFSKIFLNILKNVVYQLNGL